MFFELSKLSTDDIRFDVEYCETGCTLKIIENKTGSVLFRLSRLPPGKMDELRERLNFEYDEGIMIDPVTKRRRSHKMREMPLPLEGM
jgi:hypothetical protein